MSKTLADAYKAIEIEEEYTARVEFALDWTSPGVIDAFNDQIDRRLDTYKEMGCRVELIGTSVQGSIFISGNVRKEVKEIARDFTKVVHHFEGDT